MLTLIHSRGLTFIEGRLYQQGICVSKLLLVDIIITKPRNVPCPSHRRALKGNEGRLQEIELEGLQNFCSTPPSPLQTLTLDLLLLGAIPTTKRLLASRTWEIEAEAGRQT